MNAANSSSSTIRRCGAALLLVVVVLAVYGQVVGHGFVTWDDPQHLRDNPQLNPVSWHGLARIWTEPYWGLYIPLSYTFFAGEALVARRPLPDQAGWMFDPAVFHAGSLALHIGCVLLVFVILRRLFRHDGAACAGALLFALHPLEVEAVAWISESRGLLCALFSLLAVWQYLGYVGESATETATSRRIHYALATAAFALALLSKPTAVAVPLVIGVLDVGLLRRSIRRTAMSIGPWLVVSAAWVVLTKSQQPSEMLAFIPPLWARPLIAGDALAFYLVKLVAVWNLGPDYGRTPAWTMGQWLLWVAWLLPVVVLIVLSVPRGRRLWLTSAGIFVVWLLPVLGLVPFNFQRISTVSDRYAYLAMLGPAVALGGFLAGRWNRRTVTVTAIGLTALAAVSFFQVSHWRGDAALWAHALRVNPHSLVASHNRGFLLAEKGEHAEAIRWFRAALVDHPTSGEAYRSLGVSLAALGKTDEAAEALQEAARLEPRSSLARCELAHLLAEKGATDEAVELYREVTRLDPRCVPAYLALGRLLLDQENPDAAVRLYEQALEANPDDVKVHVNLAAALEAVGDREQAKAQYRAALGIRGDWPAAHYNLANLLAAEGAVSEAVDHYRKALSFDPHHAKAHVNLGIALAGEGKTDEAIAHYRTALRIDPNLIEAHLNLGSALAAKGRPREAAAALRNALRRLRPDSARAEQAREILRQLENR